MVVVGTHGLTQWWPGLPDLEPQGDADSDADSDDTATCVRGFASAIRRWHREGLDAVVVNELAKTISGDALTASLDQLGP